METIIFKMYSETIIPQEWMDYVPESGPADYAVECLRERYKVVVNKVKLKEYLKQFGFDALEDHEDNIDRLIWMATLDCKENETNVFYMG
jgi:hypothetical protein